MSTTRVVDRMKWITVEVIDRAIFRGGHRRRLSVIVSRHEARYITFVYYKTQKGASSYHKTLTGARRAAKRLSRRLTVAGWKVAR